MTTKAERLAAELVGLYSKYNASDFEKAIKLIDSGTLFFLLTEAARKVSRVKPGARSEGEQAAQSKDLPISREKRNIQENLLLTSDSDALRKFIERFRAKEILKTGSAIRSFAESIDLSFPSKLPGREALAERFAVHLRRQDFARQELMIKQGDTMDRESSSLQRWSDLIVKDD